MWQSAPPEPAFRQLDLTAEAHAATAEREVVDDDGNGTVAARTVLWDRHGPERAVEIIDRPDGTRTLRSTPL